MDSADDPPIDPPIDPKEAAILRAAFTCFARYGLRRTSMADIASEAGMSRPALYLRFAGKEDIFHALVRAHFQRAEREVARVLAAPGPASDALLAVLAAMDGEAAEAMMTSPHAEEIMSANAALQLPAVREAHARIVDLIARWIEREVAAGRLGLDGLGATAEDVARTFLAAKDGIKAMARDFDDYRAGQRRIAAIFGRALTC